MPWLISITLIGVLLIYAAPVLLAFITSTVTALVPTMVSNLPTIIFFIIGGLVVEILAAYEDYRNDPIRLLSQDDSWGNRLSKNTKYGILRWLISPSCWLRLVLKPFSHGSLLGVPATIISCAFKSYCKPIKHQSIRIRNLSKPETIPSEIAKPCLKYTATMDYARHPGNEDAKKALSNKNLTLVTKQSPFIYNQLPSIIKDNINEQGFFVDRRTGLIVCLCYDNATQELIITYGCSGSTGIIDNKESVNIHTNYFWQQLGNWICAGLPSGSSAKGIEHQAIRIKCIHWWTNILNFLGIYTRSMEQGIAFAKVINSAFINSDIKVTLAGMSLGGMHAQAAGTITKLATHCYNSAPMGSSLQQRIGLYHDSLTDSSVNITHINYKKDWLSTCRGWKITSAFLTLLTGIGTPRSVGPTYTLPVSTTRKYSGSRYDQKIRNHGFATEKLEAFIE